MGIDDYLNPFRSRWGARIFGGLLVVGGALTGQPGIAWFGASMLAGSFAGAPPVKPLGGAGLAASATYGQFGMQNAAFEGAPRFVVLGEEKIAPSYVSVQTRDHNDGTIRLYALLYAGEGGPYGIESLTDFKADGEPLDASETDTIEIRYGTQTQTAIQGFEYEYKPIGVGTALKGSTSSCVYATSTQCDEVTIVFKFGNGLQSSGNGRAVWKCTIEVKEGSGSYSFIVPTSVDHPNWYVRQQAAHKRFVTPGWPEWGTGWLKMVKLVFPSQAYRTIRIKPAGNSSYVDTYRYPTVDRVEERQDKQFARPGTVMVGIKLNSYQIKNRAELPRITCICRGWKVQNQGDTSAAWTRNPSKLLEALLTNTSDGCGDWITSAMLDNGAGGSWRTVAARCDAEAASSGAHKEAHWQLDYVLDADADAIEHISAILATFRASLMEAGEKIYLLQDVAGSTVATFDGRQQRSPSNRPMLADAQGSPIIAEQEIGADDTPRPTHVRVQYRDRTDSKYESRWTSEMVSPEWSTGLPIVRRETFLVGITRETQAIREARFILNCGRLRTLNVEFGVGIGDLDLVPGDVVALYLDYPAWSGKLFQVLAASIRPDGTGHVRALEYSADAYTDTSDTLPAKPAWVSRQKALETAGKRPAGAANVSIREVAG